MSENYYFIETIRSRNGYQWSNNKIKPIRSITPEGEYYNEEQVILFLVENHPHVSSSFSTKNKTFEVLTI